MTSPAAAWTAPTNKPWLLGLVGAAALVVGSFMTWIKASAGLLGTLTRSGIDGGGDGWLFVLLGASVAAVILRAKSRHKAARKPGAIALALGLLALGLAIYEVVHVQTRIDDLKSGSNGVAIAISIGVGLWVVVAGALAVVASGGWAFGASRHTAVE